MRRSLKLARRTRQSGRRNTAIDSGEETWMAKRTAANLLRLDNHLLKWALEEMMSGKKRRRLLWCDSMDGFTRMPSWH